MGKQFYETENIGKSRYSVSMHDGVQTHKDGSPFYGLRIFSNKRERDKFLRELVREGYTRR